MFHCAMKYWHNRKVYKSWLKAVNTVYQICTHCYSLDSCRVEILFEQCFQFGLRIILIQTVELVILGEHIQWTPLMEYLQHWTGKCRGERWRDKKNLHKINCQGQNCESSSIKYDSFCWKIKDHVLGLKSVDALWKPFYRSQLGKWGTAATGKLRRSPSRRRRRERVEIGGVRQGNVFPTPSSPNFGRVGGNGGCLGASPFKFFGRGDGGDTMCRAEFGDDRTRSSLPDGPDKFPMVKSHRQSKFNSRRWRLWWPIWTGVQSAL